MPPHLALLKFHWHKISTTLVPQTSNLIRTILFFFLWINNLDKHLLIFAMQPGIIHHRWWNSKRNPLPWSLQVSFTSYCTLLPDTSIQSNHFFLLIVIWTPYPFSTDGWLTSTKRCSIRHITARVGAAVVRAAVAEDLAEGCRTVGPKELGSMSEELYYAEINFTFV